MSETQFEVTQSITRRLKAVMIAIAIFFVLGAVGIFFSSLGNFSGIQNIYSVNIVASHVSQAIEGLETSSQTIADMDGTKNLKDIRFAFNESQKLVKEAVLSAIRACDDHSRVKAILEKGLEAILLYEESAKELFSTKRKDLSSQMIVMNQYDMDSKEYLRKAQIALRQTIDDIFDRLYANRYWPLVVGFTLSAIFFLFVVTFGFSISNKIYHSISNLTYAAQKVSEGDLTYQAPVQDSDELGQLTDTFNKMVSSIHSGRIELDSTIERIKRLQRITASFSEALTAEHVMEISLAEGLDAVNADSGVFAILNKDRDLIEIHRYAGIHHEVLKKQRSFPLAKVNPLSDVIRYHKPLYFENQNECFARYPHLRDEVQGNHISAVAFLPLIVSSECIGAISINFNYSREFNQTDKDFLVSLSNQCAQALHRSQLYDETREAVAARDEFLSIASHELKTPLTPLKLQLQLLSRQIRKGDAEVSHEKLLSIMQNFDKQLGRLSKLIEDLLDVSRITSGKLSLNLEEFNLADMINDVLTQYEHQMKKAVIKVVFISENNIVGFFDRVRLEQVLVNLLTNAVKYAPGKPISVVVEKKNDMALITVKDQGPGIAQENQERIFKRFERVKSSENIGGLGLGLYISSQIIQAHNGQIRIESELGKGSSFIIEIPLTQESKST